jgi:hypothetical protein
MLAASAFVIAFGSLILAPPASADGCVGSVPIGSTVSCPGDGSSSGFTAPAPGLAGNGMPFQYVNGIPCTSNNYHTCRALQQSGNAP